MRISASIRNQVQPLVDFPKPIKTDPLFRRKNKAVFVVGPTGTGKSKLAIDLATRIPAEVINCDKMQVYKGLDTLTNKVTADEARGVPHHLLGVVSDPAADFSAADFRRAAAESLAAISARRRLPIIAGGSNSFVESLAFLDPQFRSNYDVCFLWIDVSLPVLHSFVSERVDRMVDSGLIEEARTVFDPDNADFSRGIRRAIGVPELDEYFRSEMRGIKGKTRDEILELGIGRIKENTCKLASRQLQKIRRVFGRWGDCNIYRIDATEVFLRIGGEEAEELWEKLVAGPSARIVEEFVYGVGEEIASISPSDYHHLHDSSLTLHAPAMATR